MKYPAYVYAKALVSVLADPKTDKDAAAQRFLALVRRNGDEGRLRKILEEASRFARVESGVRKVAIASARTLTAGQERMVEGFLRTGDIVDRRIDPDLVAGITITVNDELQFDGSLKRKLETAFGS